VCRRAVDGAFVNGLLSQHRKIFGERCRNFVKLILRTVGVCSFVVWQIGTFGGTFSIFMTVCRSVKSHWYAV